MTTTHPVAITPATPPRTAGPDAWKRPAFGALVVAWGANMFASLLQTYRGDLSQVQVTTLFGAYALGLIPALLVMAKASDRLGRRAVLSAGLVLSATGTLLILASGNAFGGILAGRILVGISAGAALAPATAWIKELSEAGGLAASGARRAATALTGGFALGPLASGIIVQWLPAPRPTAYLLHVALVLVALFLMGSAPETPVRTNVPDDVAGPGLYEVLTGRLFLTAVASTAPWVFGAATTSLAALPVLVPLGAYGAVGSGAIAALTLGTGILAQPLAQRLALSSPARPFRAGLAAVIVGMLVAALTAATGWVPLLGITAVILGSAYGLLLVSGLKMVQALAPAQHAAMTTAVFYALTYVGFAAPVVIPVLSAAWSPTIVLVGVSALGLISLATTFMAWPRRR
ncbi:MFS transporter [Kineosporia sp. NBRC 101731]|uniref:MFS transporter n=1 Tax=Kineosporia sp. NBRC 101731 TaxID=3032199 RepID=UPI0024A1129D|nr:MFS transporter [Kineosporia sp. NBRC 101731]GLY28668.1 major facilitator family transporter [Kineosporia sp. NBRC 101731]